MTIDFQEELDFQPEEEKKSPSVLDELWTGTKAVPALAGDFIMSVPHIGSQIALTAASKLAHPSYTLDELWKASGEAIGDNVQTFGQMTDTDKSLPYKAARYPFEKYGQGIDFLADKIPNKDVAGAAKMLGAIAPIPFAGKVARGMGKAVSTLDPAIRNAKYEKPADVVVPQEQIKPIGEQMELPLENSAQQIAEMRGEAVGQPDLFGPINRAEQQVGRVSPDEIRQPLPNEMQGELPWKTSPEEIAAKQAEGQAQRDMFVEHEQAQRANDPVREKQAFEQQRYIDDAVNRVLQEREKQQQVEEAYKQRQEQKQRDFEEELAAIKNGPLEAIEQRLRDSAYKPVGDGQGPKTRAVRGPRGQRGAINMEVFDPMFKKEKELPNGIRLVMEGGEAGPVIHAMKDGQEVGRLGLTADDWFNPKPESNFQAAWVDTNGAPKTGLAEQMYRFAAEQGDIVPSKAQTSAGKEMWNKFEQRGVAKGGRIVLKEAADVTQLPEPKNLAEASRSYENIYRRYAASGYKDEALATKALEAGKKKAVFELRDREARVDPSTIQEVHPGYKHIPSGTRLIGTHGTTYTEPTVGIVVGTKDIRLPDGNYSLPVVDFGDGRPRTLSKFDIHKVFSGPVRVPRSQKGVLNFNMFDGALKKLASLGSKSPEVVQALAQIKTDKQRAVVSNIIPGLEAYRPKLDTPEKALAAIIQPDVKDLSATQKFMASTIKPGIRKVRISTNNPLLNFVGEATAKVFTQADNFSRKYITDKDAIGPLFNKLSDKEKVEIHQALMSYDKAEKPISLSELQKAGFNEKQLSFFQKYIEMEKVKLDTWNEKLLETGQKPVRERPGHFPGVFTGDYWSLVFDKDKKVVGYVANNTRFGYNKAVEILKQKNPGLTFTDMKRKSLGGSGVKTDLFSGMNDLLKVLAENDPRIAEVMQAVDAANAQSAGALYGANRHALEKKGIWGNEGNKPWKTDAVEAANDAFKAYFRYWEEGMLSHLNMPVEAQIKSLLNNPALDKMPRAKQYVNQYIEAMTGRSVGDVGMALNTLLDAGPKMLGIGSSVTREGVNQLNKRMGQLTMGFGNLPFTAIQYLQLLQTGAPEIVKAATAVGKSGVDVSVAGTNAVKNAFLLSREKLGGTEANVSPETREMFKYAEERGLFNFSEFQDVNKITQGKGSRAFDTVADFNRKLGEQGTRPLVFFTFVELLKDTQLPKHEVFDTAYNLTQDAMVDYSPQERPLMFKNMGVAGQLAGGLQTYMFSYLDQMAGWHKDALKGNYKPWLVGMTTALAFAGVTGLPFYQEADSLVKWATNKFDGGEKSIADIALKNAPDWAKYGAMSSATGVNMQSRLSAADVLPNSPIEAVTPYASQISRMGGAAYDAITNPDALSARNLLSAIAPSSLRGPLENLMATDEQGNYMNKRNEKEYPRTEFDRKVRNFNMVSLEESKNRQTLYEQRMKERADLERKTEITTKIERGIKVRGPSFTVSPEFAKLKDEYIKRKGDPNALDDMIVKAVKDKNMTAKQRAEGIPKANSLQSVQRYKYYNP